MVKIYCDGCGAELPKPNSKKTLVDIVATKFGLNGQPRQEKTVYCEDCTEKIFNLIKTFNPFVTK